MAKSSSSWYRQHVQDAHVKLAQKEGKRSRAVFKLTEILEHHHLLASRDAVVIDLGCAPGSWSEELGRYISHQGLVIGVDILKTEPATNVHIIQGDFTASDIQQQIIQQLTHRSVDLVVSDMAPEMSGNKLVDQSRIISLNEITLAFSQQHLCVGGHLLLKTFMGAGFDTFRQEMRTYFSSVKIIKPKASRKKSSEIFLLGQIFHQGNHKLP